MRFKHYFGGVLMVASSLLLVSLLPLPGVDAKSNVTVNGTEVPVELYSNNTIFDDGVGLYTSNGDVEFGKINLATGRRGLYDFMDVCSHEVLHARFDTLEDVEDDHKLIDRRALGGVLHPWSWQTQCFSLLDDRLGL